MRVDLAALAVRIRRGNQDRATSRHRRKPQRRMRGTEVGRGQQPLSALLRTPRRRDPRVPASLPLSLLERYRLKRSSKVAAVSSGGTASGPASSRRRPGSWRWRATLGISPTTVSNAYNRPDQLSAALRERVLRTAAELGYAGPDPLARGLRTGRAGAIGVVFHDRLAYAFDDPAAGLFLQGLTGATDTEGLAVVLVPGLPDGAAKGAAVRNAAVDGFVLHGVVEDDPLVAATVERRLPTVAVDSPTLDGLDFIGIDDDAAAETAVRHLIDLGHRELGLLSFIVPEVGDSVARRRVAGSLRAVAAAGLEPDAVAMQPCHASTRRGRPRRGTRAARPGARRPACSRSAIRWRSAPSSPPASAGSPCPATSRSSASTARRPRARRLRASTSPSARRAASRPSGSCGRWGASRLAPGTSSCRRGSCSPPPPRRRAGADGGRQAAAACSAQSRYRRQ